MMDIDDCINNLMDRSHDHSFALKTFMLCFRECEYDRLLEKGENALRCVVDLYQLYRELLLSLYELMPSVPQTENVYKFCWESLDISVERSAEYDFPVYKITLPILLPNKRKRKVERNSVITESVSAAVSQYCSENHIAPFAHATVIFLSYHPNGCVTIDNDNLDSAMIINSLNGRFIRGDCPDVCKTIYYSKVSEKAITEIFVVDSDHDVELLSFIKSTCHK